MWRQDGAWQSSQQTPTLTQTAQRPTTAIPSQTHTIIPPARGGGASTGALALRIQGGAVTTVASFAQLGAPTPDTPSQPLVAGQPPWEAAAARARAGGHVVEARRVGVDERVEGAEGRLARLQPQLVEQAR